MFATAAKNTMLDALTVNRIMLHSGDPGAAGANNQESSLETAVFDAAAAGARALNADVDVTGLTGSVAITHVSFWDSTGPTFHGSVTLTGDQAANSAGEYTLLASGTELTLSDPA